VGKPHVLDTFAGSPWFGSAIPSEKQNFIATLRRLRREQLDVAILFPNSLRPALLARLAGARTVVGFARYGRDPLLTHRLYPLRDRYGDLKPTPIIDDYNRIVQRLGVPAPSRRLELFTTNADELAAERFWQQAKLGCFSSVVGLNPGGAFGASKHWPTEHFAEVARTLAVKGHGVVVLCGPAERDEAIRIAAAAKHPHVVSASSLSPSIGLTKALVKRLALLVTTDSGPRHFAAAFDVPVVTLFGPTHIEWTETYFAKAIHLQEKLPCGPCQQRVCPLGHHQCMTQLSPQRVTTACLELLRRHGCSEVRHAG
jgi:heptosyltransferase-2